MKVSRKAVRKILVTMLADNASAICAAGLGKITLGEIADRMLGRRKK